MVMASDKLVNKRNSPDKSMTLREGMRVTLMDSNDKGIIRKVYRDHADIELDGLIIPMRMHEFIVNDPEQDRMLEYSLSSSRAGRSKAVNRESNISVHSPLPDTITIDLHIDKIPGGIDAPKGFELPFQLEYFKHVLRSNLKHRGMKIIVIHGVGDGILKDALRKEIDETFAMRCRWTPAENGVTVITIR